MADNLQIHTERLLLYSAILQRELPVDLYGPAGGPSVDSTPLVLFNDGQELARMGPETLLATQGDGVALPRMAAIHAGRERIREYGVAGTVDYMGRGDKAALYTAFVLEELLPCLTRRGLVGPATPLHFAGFSLGGLSALDIAWAHPERFQGAGVFSGALWWRSRGLDQGYDQDRDRIMHARIRASSPRPGMRFFFQCGSEDETADRDGNGIIDAIDDTLDLIMELERQGYRYPGDIRYLETAGGRHDPATWRKAIPDYLRWVGR